MNYPQIETHLKDYDPVEVGVFISYLKELETATGRDKKLKNPWFKYVAPETFANLYKKVALDEGLYIDGETITLANKGKVMVNYNYQAYKNKLLIAYPETLFDLQNVYEGDSFSFRKVDGKVHYTHDIADPFGTDRKIIGCYCVIKNKRGEFLETLNMPEITKMRNVAKTDNIWKNWFGEMTLKSVIKRACKRHFKDVTVNIEALDNENYDTELVDLDFKVKDMIDNADNLADLQSIYENYVNEVQDQPTFLQLLGDKKKEIKAQAHETA